MRPENNSVIDGLLLSAHCFVLLLLSVSVILALFHHITFAAVRYYAPAPRRGIKQWCCLTSVCLSVAYVGPQSRTERLRNTKIGTEVAHVTRTPVSRSKGQRSLSQKARAYGGCSRTACFQCMFFLLLTLVVEASKYQRYHWPAIRVCGRGVTLTCGIKNHSVIGSGWNPDGQRHWNVNESTKFWASPTERGARESNYEPCHVRWMWNDKIWYYNLSVCVSLPPPTTDQIFVKFYGIVGHNQWIKIVSDKVKVTTGQKVKAIFLQITVQNRHSESRQKLKCSLFSSLDNYECNYGRSTDSFQGM